MSPGQGPLPEGLVAVGRVSKPHGVRGEVRVVPMTDFPERFEHTERVTLVFPRGGTREARVEWARGHHGRMLLKLEGVDSADEAGQLRGCTLAVGEDELVELEEGEYWHFQLEGLEVHDAEEGPIGRLREVISGPAHDLYAVEGPRGEILIPAVSAYVLGVDLEAGRMDVRYPRYED